MKKRTKILVTTLLTISGLTVFLFFYGFFTPYNYLTARWDISKGRPRVLQCGEATSSDKEAGAIASKFGFTYDIIANCSVSTPIVNGIRSYNAVMTDHLNDVLGSDWKNKFDTEVDSLFRLNRVDTIRKIVLAEPEVKKMRDYLDSISNGKRQLHIWILQKVKGGANVRVCEILPDSSAIIFYYYNVDPYSLSISSVKY